MAEWVASEDGTCQVAGCDRRAAVRLDVPWAGERDVCTAHGRAWSQKEGVVAVPLANVEEEWSQGQGRDDGPDDDREEGVTPDDERG